VLTGDIPPGRTVLDVSSLGNGRLPLVVLFSAICDTKEKQVSGSLEITAAALIVDLLPVRKLRKLNTSKIIDEFSIGLVVAFGWSFGIDLHFRVYHLKLF